MASNNVSAGSWKACNQLPVGKTNGWLLTDGRYLFYVGGATAASLTGTNDIQSALVNSDGTISSWKLAGTLPKVMAFFSGTVDNGWMVLGGGNTASPVDSIYLGQLSSDGTVGSMTYLRAPISSFRNPGVVAYKGKVYYVSGNDSGSGGQQVLALNIAKQIQTSTWQTVNSLPTGLQGGIAVEYGGYLYWAGGSTDGSGANGSSKVYSALINGDGSLGAWKVAGQMPKALHRFGAVVYNGKLIIVGGQDTSFNNSQAMYWATLGQGGTIGTFQTDDVVLPVALRNCSAAVVGNKLFLAGGFTTARIPNVWSIQLGA
jgi:hypothetical protein